MKLIRLIFQWSRICLISITVLEDFKGRYLRFSDYILFKFLSYRFCISLTCTQSNRKHHSNNYLHVDRKIFQFQFQSHQAISLNTIFSRKMIIQTLSSFCFSFKSFQFSTVTSYFLNFPLYLTVEKKHAMKKI